MTIAPAPGALTIAGHPVVGLDRAGGLLSVSVALHGATLTEWARALAKLDGVRVTSGPGEIGPDRCFVATCPGFKLVISTPDGPDTALVLVSRAPQAALTVISELGVLLERLMTEPPPVAEPVATAATASSKTTGSKTTFSRRRAPLAPGKPLARTTPLQRRTPLARRRWR